MCMWLDATRNDDLSRGIDGSAGLHGGVVYTDVRDLLTLNAHCPSPDSLGRDDLAIANHQIQHRLWPPRYKMHWLLRYGVVYYKSRTRARRMSQHREAPHPSHR